MTESNPEDFRLLAPHTGYDQWADGLANDDVESENAEHDRARIGSVLGLTSVEAEMMRRRLMTSSFDRTLYMGAAATAAMAENDQRDREDTDEKTRILNENGIKHWVTRQFQLPPDPNVDRRLSTIENRETRAAVIFGDLCNFKLINDGLGHSIGDVLLKVAAQRLPQEIRFRQTEPHGVARLHGDEYLAVVQGVETEDATLMLERLQATQLAKLNSEKAQKFWRRLRKVAAGEESHDADAVSDVDPTTGEQEVHIKLGDIQIPADQVAILSLGMSHGEITHIDDLKRLKDAADETQTRSKEAIHEAMGGSYRGSSTEEIGRRYFVGPATALRGLMTWAVQLRKSQPGSESH